MPLTMLTTPGAGRRRPGSAPGCRWRAACPSAGLMTQVLPADQGRKELPDGDGHGEVPRRDQADDARRACGWTWRTCSAVRTAWSGRRGGGLRRPCRRPRRWPPARRRGFRRGPCPFRGSCRRANCSLRCSSRLPARKRISARLGAGTSRQVAKAFFAAATAASRLRRRRTEIRRRMSTWSAGLMFRMVLPLAARRATRRRSDCVGR